MCVFEAQAFVLSAGGAAVSSGIVCSTGGWHWFVLTPSTSSFQTLILSLPLSLSLSPHVCFCLVSLFLDANERRYIDFGFQFHVTMATT